MRRAPPSWPALTLGVALCLGSLGPAHAQTAPTGVPAPTAPAAGAALTLEGALELLNQAPNVTQSRLNVQVAQANLNAARTALGLTVSVTGSGSYTGPYDTTTATGTPTSVGSSVGGSAGVNVSVGVLPWSTNQYALKSAQRSLTLATAYLADAEHTARLNVAQQYYNAVNAKASVTLAAQTLTLRQRQLEIAQAQQGSGNATAETVLGAQVALQTAQAAVTQAQGTLDTARRSLGAALGRDVTGFTLTSVPAGDITLPDLGALVSRARTSRSEVVLAQNNLAAAQDTLAQDNQNATIPALTTSVRYGPAGSGGLNASLDLQKGTLSGGYSLPLGDSSGSGGTNRFVASVSGSYVVYSPSQKAQLAADQANVTQTALSLSVAQQNVELDVRSKFNAAQTAQLTLQAQQTQVQLAQTALQTAQTRLNAGVGTQDDVTQASLNLLQAQNALVSARSSAQIALIQLQNAAGGQP